MGKTAAIVFTDLDGTLLDHHSYAFTAAIPALELLKAHAIPVILASSKTAAEIASLRDKMGLSAYPAIVENGAGVLPAQAHPQTILSQDYPKIRAALAAMPAPLRRHFTGFGDMSIPETATETGLPPADAALAKERVFSEPGTWHGDDAALSEFLAYLAGQGISARQGGRYLTLSFGKTKADHMAQIRAQYGAPPVIALGDAPNDLEMLMAADYPVLIRNPKARPLPGLTDDQRARLLYSTRPGPQGWNEMVPPIIRSLTSPNTGA